MSWNEWPDLLKLTQNAVNSVMSVGKRQWKPDWLLELLNSKYENQKYKYFSLKYPKLSVEMWNKHGK